MIWQPGILVVDVHVVSKECDCNGAKKSDPITEKIEKNIDTAKFVSIDGKMYEMSGVELMLLNKINKMQETIDALTKKCERMQLELDRMVWRDHGY